MKPIVKKAIAAVAIKKGIDKIQERRQPKRSRWPKVAPLLVVVGVGGALAYLAKSGKLSPVVDKAKSLTGGGEEQQAQNQPVAGTATASG